MNVEDISKNEIITSYYKKLLSRSHIGSQYEWLARYVDSMGINNLELCNHKDGTIYNFIKDDVYFVEEENDSYYKMKEELLRPELRMFKKFRFPILDLTKIDMGEIAKKSGFFDIMQETWFCHRPTRRGTPCGWCNPCKVTREQGLSNRVPTKLVGFLNNVDRKLTRYFQKR